MTVHNDDQEFMDFLGTHSEMLEEHDICPGCFFSHMAMVSVMYVIANAQDSDEVEEFLNGLNDAMQRGGQMYNMRQANPGVSAEEVLAQVFPENEKVH